METGIIAYGVSMPKHRIESSEIWGVWKNLAESFFDTLSIGERGVLGPEEDTITLATEAAKSAISRAGISPDQIGAVILGSGTSPYATKSAATVIQDSLAIPPAPEGTDTGR